MCNTFSCLWYGNGTTDDGTSAFKKAIKKSIHEKLWMQMIAKMTHISVNHCDTPADHIILILQII